MADATSDATIQVLYEISLAIQPKADLETTVESAVSTYLQKLNCSAAGVFEVQQTDDGPLDYRQVTTLPERSPLTEQVAAAREAFPMSPDALETDLPQVDRIQQETHRYVMQLPDFGVLCLLKRGPPLDDHIEQSLPELNRKVATACNRVIAQEQRNTQYRELFEEAPVMFVLTRNVHGDPVVDDCNRQFADTLGYSREEIRGRRLAEFYAEESKRRLREGGYAKALAGEFGTAERVLETSEGTEVIAQLRATPRRDRDGDVVGTNALYVDVTELKRRNQQLSVLQRVFRHNLRNDLTAISGQVELARERTDDDVAELLDTAARLTERLFATTETADRVRRILEDTSVSRQALDDTIDDLVERAADEFPDATVRSSVEAASAYATDAIDDALWELLENACVHGGESPEVVVTVEATGDRATVTIADDGPGMPEQERRVFRRNEETKLDHGSGLGLWLVSWVLEMSGGGVSFDCSDGTTVTVTLPLADEE